MLMVTSLSNRDLIRILLQSRRFDFGTLLLSEGDPSNEALEVEESVEVSEAVEVNNSRKKSATPKKKVLEEKKIEVTSAKPIIKSVTPILNNRVTRYPPAASDSSAESGSSEGHYREGLQ